MIGIRQRRWRRGSRGSTRSRARITSAGSSFRRLGSWPEHPRWCPPKLVSSSAAHLWSASSRVVSGLIRTSSPLERFLSRWRRSSPTGTALGPRSLQRSWASNSERCSASCPSVYSVSMNWCSRPATTTKETPCSSWGRTSCRWNVSMSSGRHLSGSGLHSTSAPIVPSSRAFRG